MSNDNVFDLPARLSALADAAASSDYDRWLVSEGLDLLASFRLIEDPIVRASVISLVKALSLVSGT